MDDQFLVTCPYCGEQIEIYVEPDVYVHKVGDEYVIGLTPHLRYDFATGTRLVPFLDGGAGVTATSIGPPDMSGTFEFNLQANVGAYWFVRDHLAFTGEAGYMHMSCAGIHHPNLGANKSSS